MIDKFAFSADECQKYGLLDPLGMVVTGPDLAGLLRDSNGQCVYFYQC